MEPTKNNNESLEPVFRGMPKPGQPLTATPRVNATAPSPIATPPANLPTSNSFSSQMAPSVSQFSAHAPSALDRLMNPNIDKQIPPTPSPSASVFKPYTPPVVNVPSSTAPLTSTQSSTPVSSQTPAYTPVYTSTSPSTPASSSTFTSGYKVGAPTQYPPAQSVSSSTYSNGIPPAPSANITAAKLGSEVNSILNNQQKMPKSHKGTLALIISMIVVLLLLAGGGYYWYTYMYLPNKETSKNETTQNEPSQSSPDDFYNQANTVNTNSAFPSAVAKPTVVTQPATTPPKTTPAKVPTTKAPTKVTRVTTPFNQSQRDMVSSYIYANINQFATPKSKVPYEVTDVTFDGPDRAVVQYTNGSKFYTAVAVASIDTADNVRIVSFSLLEK